jgi:hypothetical protein
MDIIQLFASQYNFILQKTFTVQLFLIFIKKQIVPRFIPFILKIVGSR